MRNSIQQRARRRFLGQLGALAGSGAALSSMAALNWTRLAAAAEVPSDYKALICIFLFGGNDSYNCVVPSDPDGHAIYAQARRALGIPRETLLPLADAQHQDAQGRAFGLNPDLGALHPAYVNAGQLAVTFNVGPLLAPMNKAQYQDRSVPRPPSIGSHSDQQFQTQTCGIFSSDQGYTGWNGRLGDYFFASNIGLSTFTNVSLSGDNVIQVGEQVLPYAINSNGQLQVPVSRYVNGNLQQRLDAGRRALLFASNHVFDTAYSSTKARSLEGNQLLAEALQGTSPIDGFPDNRLGSQLRSVAQVISVASQIGIRRQTFFCSMGGFDTHSNQNNRHPSLLRELAAGMQAMHSWSQTSGLADKITSFTASEFARTFAMNGNDGSDHAWGGIQFVLGGAVQGGLYGEMPDQTLGGEQDISGRGRFIPGTAVDQVAAVLARWYGVPADDLPLILPNIGNFDSNSMGFMT
ncbi:MAG TPA: DUF1501 domain-containing protein [Chromatiaceae bacterium]|jgi:uncharacterized protein (DUF1501 family)|nr:MAG: hypothetical protein N838_02130 [Thiohalocapsa sp. PB-PSB1]QQO54394.1 MAG: DUF1501 domain-containing protein [Thiohalocapsa sp. PB-PSB1]HBG95567.1 DUF1501 domain-containing protein [Chromatiaceae bacterium]HCS89740.1 DUF1501 domain-containing protein [Chromatiaceae bacterium]